MAVLLFNTSAHFAITKISMGKSSAFKIAYLLLFLMSFVGYMIAATQMIVEGSMLELILVVLASGYAGKQLGRIIDMP